MTRTLDANGFHTRNGERFWSRPLYGPNRRMFVPAGELPHASFMWFEAQTRAFVRCGHLLPGVVSVKGTKWLYQAEDVVATYDPGLLRFVCRDPGWDGEVRMLLVPLAANDGYMVQFSASAPIELAFAFGGFLCLPDKDRYQGTGEAPGGIVAEAFTAAAYAAPEEGMAVTTLPTVNDTEGRPLNLPLQVVLLCDRRTTASLQEATTGVALADLLQAAPAVAPVQIQRLRLAANEPLHLVVVVPQADRANAEVGELRQDLAGTFAGCLKRVHEISHRVVSESPDTLVDLAGRSLSVSMDGLWVPPVFMHGPIRWGWPGLVGWRMAYGSDVCGTYDRTASHLKYYADTQARGGLERTPHADPKSALTRQAPDSILFSDGSVVNWGVYNMTELWLNFVAHHYDWTGDKEWLKAIWPAVRAGLAFEKRAMDMDGDSLYENYANTYITDAHWHNGGNCTQASAYVYAGCMLAAAAAELAGESPKPYLAEAARIRDAMNRVLWIREKGVFAEWQDTLGEKLLHPEPELGSVYLPVHCGVADDFQAYQMVRWTEWGLPNHEFEEETPQPFDGYYKPGATYAFPQPLRAREVKSSNWRPIILTVHECSPGELMDLARVYYHLGLADRAFPLVKAVLRCMVNLPTVGGLVIRDRNAEQWCRSWAHNDVDHCDTLGSSLQCLAEGLFGIHPHLAQNLIEIQPGFPSEWDHARIQLREVSYSFKRMGATDTFVVSTPRPVRVRLRLALRGDGATLAVNGQAVTAAVLVPGIGQPFAEAETAAGTTAEFVVTHGAEPLPRLTYAPVAAQGLDFTATCEHGTVIALNDPQGVFSEAQIAAGGLTAKVAGTVGNHTAFLRVKGRKVEFWAPVDVEIRTPLELVGVTLTAEARSLDLGVRNNGPQARDVLGTLDCPGLKAAVQCRIEAGQTAPLTVVLQSGARLTPGPNPVTLSIDGQVAAETRLDCWDLFRQDPARQAELAFDTVDLSTYVNDNLALVHTHEYLAPRSPYCSLQIASDLFREWCSCQAKPCGELDLTALRQLLATPGGILLTDCGIPFRATADGRNIVFVSQWENYPKRVSIPIERHASGVYVLMASVTNPMQSGVVNGRVVVRLAGNRQEVLELVNPGNLSWCITNYPNRYGPVNRVQPAVKLGANLFATVYGIPLRSSLRVEALDVEAVSLESVIGLMGVTLVGTE